MRLLWDVNYPKFTPAAYDTLAKLRDPRFGLRTAG